MNKPKIYYSTPICGAAGKDASRHYMEENQRRAIANVKHLRQVFPDIDWYCPAENDTLITILYVAGKISYEDILWGDKEIIKGCDGIVCHQWERSNGVAEEYQFALRQPIPAAVFLKPLELRLLCDIPGEVFALVDYIMEENNNEINRG